MGTKVEDPGIPLVSAGHTNGQSRSLYGSANSMQSVGKYENVGSRLARRKQLFTRRKLAADLCLLCAVLGIVLMITDTELCIAESLTKSSPGSNAIRACISLSTAALLICIICYHCLDAKVFMIDNSMDDWRLAATSSRLLQLLMELSVCCVHPPPGRHELLHISVPQLSSSLKHRQQVQAQHNMPTDVFLGLPMFMRLYLICRVAVLHSKLFQDASSQSLGALNRVPFNFRFIFKSLMSIYPEYVLTSMALALFVLASWATRACEMYNGDEHKNIFNSMWLTAVTFLTVGYGDIVPISYCGRGIAVITGIFGTGVTALVVAVLARRLELSRAEKYVHNFVIDIELDKKMRHAAANIVKEGWLSYKCRQRGSITAAVRHQRRLLHAVHKVRQLRNEQRKLIDSSVTLVEMHKSQGHALAALQQLHTRSSRNEEILVKIEQKLDLLLPAAAAAE